MEKTFKTTSSFFATFFKTGISLMKVVFRSSFGLKLPPPKNKSCIVLGNGPSLKTSLEKDLQQIKKHDLVCVNNFAYSEYFEILKPQNYVLLDRYFFTFSENTQENRVAITGTFEKLKSIDWEINFILPAYAKNSYLVKKILEPNKKVSIFYFNYVVFEGFDSIKNFIFKKNLGMPQCQNILSASLFLNVSRGYDEIFIIGADHSWHEDIKLEGNKIIQVDTHFYEKGKPKNINLTDRSVGNLNMATFFLSLYNAFRTYDVIKNYADYRKVKIYNASVKSYVDSFERREIN